MVDRSSGSSGVVWFRKDLRLGDNPAWAAATAAHREVVGLFVIEPALMAAGSSRRRDLLLANLDALDRKLRDLGGALVVRHGPAREAVSAVLEETEASAVYLNSDRSLFSLSRDREALDSVAAEIRPFEGSLVHAPGTVTTNAGTLSQVFTPFFKVWSATPLAPWPEPGDGRPVALETEPIPSPSAPPAQEGGEDAAWDRLSRWSDRVDDYDEQRNRLDTNGTSELSTDLKFGTLAARTILEVIGTSTPGRAAFVRQLAWRDWYAHTLAERPDLPIAAVKPKYDRIAWRDDPEGFAAWCEGRTGYPVVDAGMRELTGSGRMHNRARMICASFLVKDLLIDWRLGERFFRHHLLDADVAQNAGNWQWVAGTGPDAAPYFRVFNPTAQGVKFDPDGSYIRRWVPELADLAAPAVHEPAAAGPLALAAAGVELGVSYPHPLVDHAQARERALGAYKAATG